MCIILSKGRIVLTKTVKGLKINYIDEGQGELVVLLHGWGSNIKLFQASVDLLKKGYRVVTMDMPGFGESEEPKEPWSVDDYVDFLLEFLKDYDFSEVTLLGHSFGGRVIIKLCSRENPFEVEKVILVDAAGVKPKKTLKQKIRQRIYKMTKWIFSLKIVMLLFPDALEKLRKRNGSADYNAASPVMRQTLVKVVNEDLTHLMPNVKCPALLIWGTADDATPLSDAEIMEKLMPQAGLVTFEGAGHYSFLERQAQYLRVLASFMKIDL
ncbi:MAG: alpha/beta hydrolase [Ruminococcaceae bacterium]|nr:alpha/beta hydrolase [Oscillospiraceae bacterium]